MNERGGGGGGGDEAPAPEKVDPVQEAGLNFSAMQQYNPQAAALEYGIQSQYIPQLAGLYSDVREQSMPGGQALTGTFVDQLTQQLLSPQAMTPEYLAATDAIRNREMGRTTEAMRTEQNLGGGLFGGRSQRAREETLGQMGQAYDVMDYDRLMSRLAMTQQAAQNFIAQYMGQQVPTLNYQSPVVDPSLQYQTTAGQNNLTAQLQAQQQQQQMANQAALYSSLFKGLGSATGGFLGGSAFDNLMTK